MCIKICPFVGKVCDLFDFLRNTCIHFEVNYTVFYFLIFKLKLTRCISSKWIFLRCGGFKRKILQRRWILLYMFCSCCKYSHFQKTGRRTAPTSLLCCGYKRLILKPLRLISAGLKQQLWVYKGGRQWLTWQPRAARRKVRMVGDTGAAPVIISLTRPPRLAWKGLKPKVKTKTFM